MQRIRIQYHKGEALQYIGNLDLHKVWERTFRRAQIPLAYSQGFHPQPRMHQACPLPLGFTSSVELLDFWCDSEESLEIIKQKLIQTVQPGIEIQSLSNIPLKHPALQTLVDSVAYLVTLDDSTDVDQVRARLEAFKNSTQCLRERRGKTYDLMPLIQSLIFEPGMPARVFMRLLARPGATGRPEEILEELGVNPFSVDVVRVELNLNPFVETASLG